MPLLSRQFRRSASAVLLLALVASTSGAFAVPPARPAAKEVELKAAFLLNFAAFVEWPVTAFDNSSSPIVVGIYGEDTLGRAADDIFAGENVRGRPLVLRRVPRGTSAQGCHILFVGEAERGAVARALASATAGPTLTVGNGPGFIEAGGMIEFTTERGRLRFRINRPAAEKAGLVLSSKLLRLAQNAPP